jgi:biotin carboxyl carrier protein
MPEFILRFDGRPHTVAVEDARVVVDGEPFDVAVEGEGRSLGVWVRGRQIPVVLPERLGAQMTLRVAGAAHAVELVAGRLRNARQAARWPLPGAKEAPGVVEAPMSGTIGRVLVQPGDAVEAGALLLTLEAMKMENEIRAPHPGRVQRVAIAIGQRVAQGALLVLIG